MNQNQLKQKQKLSTEDETTSSSPDKKVEFDFEKSFQFSSDLSLETIRKLFEEFSEERDWAQFHAPRNMLLNLVSEVGELSEIFQWKGELAEGCSEFSDREKEHLGEELSDVLMSVVRLADRCHVDLPSAVLRKLKLNKKNYPASQARGSNKKYTEYENAVDKS